jgi:hypothetical protein
MCRGRQCGRQQRWLACSAPCATAWAECAHSCGGPTGKQPRISLASKGVLGAAKQLRLVPA